MDGRPGPAAENTPKTSANEVTGEKDGQSRQEIAGNSRSREKEIEVRLNQIETTYGRFFVGLTGWSTEQKESLRMQLALDGLEQQEQWESLLGAPGEEQDEQRRRLLARQREDLIKALGPDGYERLQEYRAGLTYRPQVAAYADAMRGQGVKLTIDDEERLLRAYVSGLLNGGAKTNSECAGNDARRASRVSRKDVSSRSSEISRRRTFGGTTGRV